jgi:hypothetical protein
MSKDKDVDLSVTRSLYRMFKDKGVDLSVTCSLYRMSKDKDVDLSGTRSLYRMSKDKDADTCLRGGEFESWPRQRLLSLRFLVILQISE